MAAMTSMAVGLAFLLVVTVMGQPEEINPAPASIGTDIPATYFGPAPSQVQKELIGPYQLLKSGTVDLVAGTIELPLYRGYLKGLKSFNIWYVLTDTSDSANAAALGLNPSSKLLFGAVGARTAKFAARGVLEFTKGWVDFSPERVVVPGDKPNYFPPKSFSPPSVGKDGYSPLVLVTNSGGSIYNAPIIAGNFKDEVLNQFCDGIPENMKAKAAKMLHTKVLKICPRDQVVTLQLTTGFSFGRPVLYLSTDASLPLPATLEGATYSEKLGALDGPVDDNFGSAVERLFLVTNGYTNGMAGTPGEVHPLRQGFNSALRGDGGPLNVLGGIPTVATDYSPIWKLNAGEWTAYAWNSSYVTRVLDEFTYLGFVKRGFITAPGGGEFGSADVGVVNCPIVQRFL